MTLPKFTGDEDEDKINPLEWLRLVKEYGIDSLEVKQYFSGEAWKWWMSIDQDTRWNCTSE
jgi:hypothetical protein